MNPTTTPLTNTSTGVVATPNAQTTPAQMSAAQAQGFTPTPIAADSLSQATTPIKVPTIDTTVPTTVGTPVPVPAGVTIGADGLAVPPGVMAPPKTTGSTSDTQSWIKTQLASLGSALGTKGAVTTQLQDQMGLSQKTLDAINSYNAYNQAKVELANRIESMHSHQFGLTGGTNEAIAVAQREGNANLANLAIIAQTSQGLLDAANSTIKAKLDAQFQPITDQIDFLTKFNTVNSNDLTESQKTQLNAKIEQQKTDLASVQSAASDIHERLAQNNAPASVYSAVDKAVNDFTSGKITAQEAQSQMYSAIGQYGSKNKYTVVTNPLTGAQSAFDTVTGTFKSPNGAPIDTKDMVNNPTLATSTINKTAPVIINGVVTHPPTGNVIVDTAQQLVDGNQAPSQIPKRGPAYTATLAKANELSLAQTGKPYSPVDAEAAYKFRNSPTYQKFISNAPVAISTISTIVNDVKKLEASGFSFGGPDPLNSTKLTITANGLNPLATPEQRAIAKELKNTLGAISADDIGLLLGSGSGSDYKTKLGGAIFDSNGNVQTTEQIAKTVQDRIQSKMDTYYKMAGIKDPSIYATRDTQAIVGDTFKGISNPTPAAPVLSNGVDLSKFMK